MIMDELRFIRFKYFIVTFITLSLYVRIYIYIYTHTQLNLLLW